MKTFIVTAATVREVADILEPALGTGGTVAGGYQVCESVMGDARVVVAVTGIGKVNTAAAVTTLIQRYEPVLLINTGCCGAYPGSGLAVGDIVVATSETYGDEGIETPDGWRSLEMIGIPALKYGGVSYFNTFPLSQEMIDYAESVAAQMGRRLCAGPFVTVSACSGTRARGVELARRHGAVCESMEGAAAAHVALSHGIPFLEVRGVSNFVEDRDLSRWDIDGAVAQAQAFIMKFISCRAGVSAARSSRS